MPWIGLLWIGIGGLLAWPHATKALDAPSQFHEKIEWTWSDQPKTIDPALPDVLLVGDSITRNYYEATTHALAGRANVYLFATSASAGDQRLPEQLREYARMMRRHFAVVHFNNGMHGWNYSDAAYAKALPALVATLHECAPGARLVWASTTPVRKDQTPGPTNARVAQRNAAAAKLMRGDSIMVDDQHRLMLAHGTLHQDDVHFSPEGSAIQAKQVADAIARLLPSKAPE